MKNLLFAMFVLFVLCMASAAQSDPARQQAKLPAPTYYLAVNARTCEGGEVRFNGASNLPKGAMIGITISDFDHYAWKEFSGEIFLPIDENGFFDGRIQPKQGMLFRGNLILVAEFTTFRPQQPADVLRVAGKKGQNLGDPLTNPQMGQVSGPYYLLEAIARASCG